MEALLGVRGYSLWHYLLKEAKGWKQSIRPSQGDCCEYKLHGPLYKGWLCKAKQECRKFSFYGPGKIYRLYCALKLQLAEQCGWPTSPVCVKLEERKKSLLQMHKGPWKVRKKVRIGVVRGGRLDGGPQSGKETVHSATSS